MPFAAVSLNWNVACVFVTLSSFYLPEGLPADRGLDPDLGADRGAVRRCSDQLKHDPIVAVPVVPIEEVDLTASVGNEQVQEAVVVVIAATEPDRGAMVLGQRTLRD
jgi:hypothetical protein